MDFEDNLYIFPFEKLKNYLASGIYKSLDSFYSTWINKYTQPPIKSIDKKKHIVEVYLDYYNNDDPNYIVHPFERTVKYSINALIFESLKTIKGGLNQCHPSNHSCIKYITKLKPQIEELLRYKSVEEFDYLPHFLKPLEYKLSYYLKLYKKTQSNTPQNSYFKPKHGLGLDFFAQLYKIAIDHKLILAEFEKDKFVNVLIAEDTTEHIKFSCDGALMITFLVFIEKAFDDFNPKTIAESKRFRTKTNTLLSITNHETCKSRVGQFGKPNKIEDLKEDLELLFYD